MINFKRSLRKILFYPSYINFKEGQIISRKEANNRIVSELHSGKPTFIARCGGVELDCCEEIYYMNRHIRKEMNPIIRERINLWAGVFPNDDVFLKKFAKIYAKSVKNVSLMSVWKNHSFQYFFVKKYSKCRTYMPWRSVYPGINDWTKELKNKKVLVVHPFAKTITEQYAKRDLIFSDSSILPPFHLLTYKPVVSHGVDTIDGFKTWEEALLKMFNDINKLDFDIALLGCGAYGLPLGNLIYQNMHKQVVHVGGSLQILFGIKGATYENNDEIKNIINDSWVYPSEDETPDVAKKVEDYSYWRRP